MRLAALIASGVAAACGVDAERDEPHGAIERPDSARASWPVESLAALGYADWDATTDSDRPTVAVHDRARVQAWPRAWANDRDLIHVIDVDGTLLSTITVPGRTQVEFARFLDGGRIACVSVDEGLTLLEADGTLVWHFDAACHHDVAVVPDGRDAPERTFALAVHDALEWRGRMVRFDEVIFIDERTGQASTTIATWSTATHREALLRAAQRAEHPLDDPPERRQADAGAKGAATTYDYFHLNAITFDGPDTMLLCLRNVDLIVRVDVGTGALGRALGPGVVDWPHAPSIVERGGRAAILAFDNGYHRGWSRALEVDPTTGEVLWEYRGTDDDPLFSPVRGHAQRLPNGNTLITESERGRVLEVTEDGVVVWEFWNPELRQAERGRLRRRIYRMTAVPPHRLAGGLPSRLPTEAIAEGDRGH